MPKAEELGIVEVAAGFVCPAGAFKRGDLYRSDDPIVKKYPDQFIPARVQSTKPEPRVEQATAAPGEKRGR